MTEKPERKEKEHPCIPLIEYIWEAWVGENEPITRVQIFLTYNLIDSLSYRQTPKQNESKLVFTIRNHSRPISEIKERSKRIVL